MNSATQHGHAGGGRKDRVDTALQARLPAADATPARLHQAMRYAVLNGGKRIRGQLVYAAGATSGAADDVLDAPACAVELLHAYSLVHDDLPAMDDDALRRGKPTCHVAYDEATAILVGDALQALSIEVLADDPMPGLAPTRRVAMISRLVRAAGSIGMVGGQAQDIGATGRSITLAQLRELHERKTGALIRASVALGAMAGPRVNDDDLDVLDGYAQKLGLAFQIMDDVLDVESDTATLGKLAGADRSMGKSTYPDLVGLTQAKQLCRDLYREADLLLDRFGAAASELRALGRLIVERSS